MTDLLKRSLARNSGTWKAPSSKKFTGGGWSFPIPAFIDRMNAQQRKVLYYAGRASLRRYKRMLGKEPPAERTKTGRISSRYKKEILHGKQKYPYRRQGMLRDFSNFEVIPEIGIMRCGPMLFASAKGSARSGKTTPEVLNEGGQVLTGNGYARIRSFNWTTDLREFGEKMMLQAFDRYRL